MADGRLAFSSGTRCIIGPRRLRLPTLAKPSSGSHLRRRIQSTCLSLVAPRIHATHLFKFRCPALPVCSVSCIPLTNEPVSGDADTWFESFRFGKCLERNGYP
ncbi:hypothetical protein TNCV_5020631 [Trichonephila clavipes]|nr:hypothetical protein TNCV_5020631 [Trichonephila clavipes]